MLGWMGPLDGAAFGLFALTWAGYTAYVDHTPARERSITAFMTRKRRAWMETAARRDLRIIDTQILGNLLTGVGFFASTTIFVLGGLMAMLGMGERATAILADIPFATATASAKEWEAKVLLLLLIFVYAFFKFAWAFRLANYCSITVGSMPAASEAETPRVGRIVATAAALSTQSGHHFNRGLRAYFFGLAALGWLGGAPLFMGMTVLVVAVLYRREFLSKSLAALRAGEEEEEDDAEQPQESSSKG